MITKIDARRFVGGHWNESGCKQFNFLLKQGLKPFHDFLEVGCGNCRAARYFIDYLEPKHYFGLDHHQWLIDAAFEHELTEEEKAKEPTFLVNDNFDFTSLGDKKFDFVLAKSVFTHLTKEKIEECLRNVRGVIDEIGVFNASIFEGKSDKNPITSDDTRRFMYSIDEIRELATGWEVEPCGHSGCYRQKMLEFSPI